MFAEDLSNSSPSVASEDLSSASASVSAEDQESNDCQPKVTDVRKAETGLAKGETRNLLLLGLIFSVYFGFRMGTLVVLPLASKELLRDELGGAARSPLYELPLAVWFTADILLATPNAYIMRTYGRRPAFVWGGCSAFLASIGAFCVLRFGSRTWTTFALLNVCVLVMAQMGMAEFVRFAAAEACTDQTRRSRIVSRVIGCGACLSTVAPFSASMCGIISREAHEDDLFGYAYFFLCLAGFSLVIILAASMLRLPSLPASASAPAAPLLQILRRRPVWTAIVAQLAVQFAMVTPMSAVPLAMTDHIPGLEAADLRISGCVILHTFSMFVPGFWTGDVIARLGEVKVMGIGLALQATAIAVCLTGTTIVHFYLGLCIIGVGWNMAFVAGTMLVVQSHEPSEWTKVASTNETLRFTANAAAVLMASSLSWQVLMFVSLLALLPAGAVLLPRRRAPAAKQLEAQ